MGLTLDQIRQQFNIPKSTSDADVMKIAIENNIVIDFSGSNDVTTSFDNNSDVSVWGAPPSQDSGDSDDPFGGMGLSLGHTSSVKAAENHIQQRAVSEAAEATEGEKTEKSALETRTETILAQIFGDREVKIKSKEVKDGKERIETEDGTIIEIPLQEGDEGYDATKVRSDVQYKIFKDGNVTVKNQDGTESTRKAVNGEEGYVKDGESFDERLSRFYDKYDPEKTSLEDKKKYAKLYVAKYLAGKNDKVQIDDFKKLLRNTPPDSDMGRTLVSLAGELNDNVINQAIEEVYGTRQTDEDIAAVTDELTNGGIIEGIENQEVQAAVYRTASRHVKTEDNATALARTSTRVKAENQTDAVRAGYENITDEKLKAAFRAQSSSLIAEYDTDAVLDIAQVHIDNDDEEHTAAKNMADNGQNLDVSIQKQFAELLTSLGIEDVSEILASHAYEYDESIRDGVIDMLKEQGYDKTMAALEKSRQEYEEKAANAQKEAEAKRAQREAEARAAEEAKAKKEAEARNAQSPADGSKTQTIRDLNRGSGAAKAVMTETFKNSDVKDKEEYINSLSEKDKQDAIKSLVENAQGFELDGLMFSGLKDEILSYLVSHPTPKNNNTLRYLQRYLSSDDKKDVSDMQKERQKNGFSTNISQRAQMIQPDVTVSNQNREQKNPFLFNFKINK